MNCLKRGQLAETDSNKPICTRKYTIQQKKKQQNQKLTKTQDPKEPRLVKTYSEKNRFPILSTRLFKIKEIEQKPQIFSIKCQLEKVTIFPW